VDGQVVICPPNPREAPLNLSETPEWLANATHSRDKVEGVQVPYGCCACDTVNTCLWKGSHRFCASLVAASIPHKSSR
jgi:hypothetical protein